MSSLRQADGTNSATPGALLLGLKSWYWDVDRDLVWIGPGIAGLDPVEQQAWLTERRDADAVPMATWLYELLEGDQQQADTVIGRIRAAPLRTESRWIVHTPSEAQWYSLRAVVAETADGLATKVFGIAFDATAYRRAEAELAFREDILEMVGTGEQLPCILEALCDGLERRLDGWANVQIHDREAGRLWHATRPSPRLPAGTATRHGMLVAEGNGASGTAAARGEDVFIEDIHTHPYTAGYVAGSASRRIAASWAHPLVAADGVVVGVICLNRGKTGCPTPEQVALLHRYGRLATLAIERAALNEELLRSASIDHHTKLPNRARFLEQATRRLIEDPQGLSVLVFDVNGLDTLMSGRHAVDVDAILAELAGRVVLEAGPDRIVASLDAGRFVLAAPGGPEDVRALGESILQRLDEPVVVKGGVFYVSGVAGISRRGREDAYGLVREATGALHAAHSEAHGRLRFYDDALHRRIVGRTEREADLRRAIKAQEFLLLYQPAINTATETVAHVEALVRWQHPTRGMVGPDEFIGLAERTGLIVPLGDLVFDLAIAQARRWRDHSPGLRIAVNVSPVQLADPGFAEHVLARMAAGGVAPTKFAIEVTESGLIEAPDIARVSLQRLKDAGTGIAVDDFGTGHSSLARLDEMPATGLKIDKSFIQRLTGDPIAPKIVRAIIDVASAHGLVVVAEGVEDAETYAAARDLGCEYVQGYHLSRPLLPEDIEQFLTASHGRRARLVP